MRMLILCYTIQVIPYPMFVPNFKILGAVVPEKSLTKKKSLHTDTHRQTLLRKRQKLYTP